MNVNGNAIGSAMVTVHDMIEMMDVQNTIEIMVMDVNEKTDICRGREVPVM